MNDDPAASRINVNLMPCTHDCGGDTHALECPAQPVRLLCPVPRSFALKARLGACSCGEEERYAGARCADVVSLKHGEGCAAEIVRCRAFVRPGAHGEEWAGSHVTMVETENGTLVHYGLLKTRAHEIWEVMKALVLGRHGIIGPDASTCWHGLERQRDAVYAALCEMVGHEAGHAAAQRKASAALPMLAGNSAFQLPLFPTSNECLVDYVEHLNSQVGVLR